MKMLIKQRFFSWLDSYTVSAEDGSTLYTVEGQLSWGHCLKVYDAAGQEPFSRASRASFFEWIKKNRKHLLTQLRKLSFLHYYTHSG